MSGTGIIRRIGSHPTMKNRFGQRVRSMFYGMLLGLVIPSLALGQTATLLPNAKQQYVDDLGAPVANGTVTYYVPSTTTKKTVWLDAGKVTQSTNPVQLDSAGRPQPTGQTFGDGCYQQKVLDQNSVQVWSTTTCSTGGSGGGTAPAFSEGVMIGTMIYWANPTLPAKYLYTAGQAISRASYPDLLTALTLRSVILCQAGIATITVSTAISDTVPLGAPIEVSCFAAGTTVISKASGLLTLSTNATATLSTNAVLFPWGNGDGATTFNVPDNRGRVLAGRDNMTGAIAGVLTSTYYLTPGGAGVNPRALNAVAGSQSHLTVMTDLPNNIPGSVIPGAAYVAGNTSGSFTISAGVGTTIPVGNLTPAYTVSIHPGADQTPFSQIQPTLTTDIIIKALADDTPGGPGVSSIQGMTGAISCGPNLVCTANSIDSNLNGFNFLASTTLATTAVLPNTPTYSNGASGVGATLTAGSNTTLTVDGTAAPLSTVVLVQNQASAFQNGIYTVTTAGGGTPWVLTRATYFDVAAEMKVGSYTFITGGVANVGKSFLLQAAVSTVGTDPLTWVLFQATSGGANVSGAGAPAVGDLAAFANTSATAIVGTGFNANQIPGVIPATATVTISNATPAVVTWAAHGRSANDTIFFCTTGSLPSGLAPCVLAVGATSPNTYKSNPQLYYVVGGASLTVNTFTIASTMANAKAGIALATGSAGSGTHTAFANAMACTGCVGEYIYDSLGFGAPSALSTGVDKVWGTISLTPGIWLVGGSSAVNGAAGTVFQHMHAGIVNGFATIPTSPYNGVTAAHVTSNSNNGWAFTNDPEQIFLTSTTTMNGVMLVDFTVSTAGAYGKIWAIRQH